VPDFFGLGDGHVRSSCVAISEYGRGEEASIGGKH
jgi:hypothetical protein